MVSPNKICVQFNDVNLKLRPQHLYRDELVKPPGKEVGVFVDTTGKDDVEFIAVGMTLDVLKETQVKLLDAYKEHQEKHPGALDDFLQELHSILGELI